MRCLSFNRRVASRETRAGMQPPGYPQGRQLFQLLCRALVCPLSGFCFRLQGAGRRARHNSRNKVACRSWRSPLVCWGLPKVWCWFSLQHIAPIWDHMESGVVLVQRLSTTPEAVCLHEGLWHIKLQQVGSCRSSHRGPLCPVHSPSSAVGMAGLCGQSPSTVLGCSCDSA